MQKKLSMCSLCFTVHFALTSFILDFFLFLFIFCGGGGVYGVFYP